MFHNWIRAAGRLLLILPVVAIAGCSVKVGGGDEPQGGVGVPVELLQQEQQGGHLDKVPNTCLKVKTGFGINTVTVRRVNQPSSGAEVTTSFAHCDTTRWERENPSSGWTSGDSTPASDDAYEKPRIGG